MSGTVIFQLSGFYCRGLIGGLGSLRHYLALIGAGRSPWNGVGEHLCSHGWSQYSQRSSILALMVCKYVCVAICIYVIAT